MRHNVTKWAGKALVSTGLAVAALGLASGRQSTAVFVFRIGN